MTFADRFEGKVVWVTGAASGIGRAAAQRFGAESASVVVSDIDADGAEETVALIEKEGGAAVAVECDVASLAACEQAVAVAKSEYGGLDCVFANAGIGRGGLSEFISEAEWGEVIDVNLTGVWRTAKASLGELRVRGGGAIVITSSIEGLVGSQLLPAYCAAKTGLLGLTRSLADEGAPHGVRVNSVCPGLIETQMTAPIKMLPEVEQQLFGKIPMSRAGQPEDVAGVVTFLCSDDARYVTGQWIAIDGGMTAVS